MSSAVGEKVRAVIRLVTSAAAGTLNSSSTRAASRGAARRFPTHRGGLAMRKLLSVAVALALVAGFAHAEDKKDPPKQAPKIVLQSPDGKKSYDLEKLTAEGPVLVRLTCACSGCDQELAYFQKLQAAYNAKGLKTIAVFKEKAESLDSYVVKKNIQFMWLSDPTG